MPRPKRKSRPNTSAKLSGSWALLIIDNEPIRRRALKDYQAAEKNLLSLRGEIEAFETRDLPAYHRWEASVFGALLTEIREMESAAAEKQRVLAEIEEEALWTNCSMVAAYRKVMRRLSRPETFSSDRGEEDDPFAKNGPAADDASGKMFGDSDLPPGFDFADYDTMSRAEKKEFHASYANVAALFEAMTGIPAPNLDDVLRRERGEAGPEESPRTRLPHSPPPRKTPEGDRIKSLYRRLARELHPDANPNHGWRERELWHEVQAAYLARDLERLEAAAGRVEIGVQGASHNLPLHRLSRMTRDLRNALRGLKAQIRHARAHAAWNFSTLTTERSERENQHRRMLMKLKGRTASKLARFSEILDALAAKAAEPRRGRKRPRRFEDDPRQAVFF